MNEMTKNLTEFLPCNRKRKANGAETTQACNKKPIPSWFTSLVHPSNNAPKTECACKQPVVTVGDEIWTRPVLFNTEGYVEVSLVDREKAMITATTYVTMRALDLTRNCFGVLWAVV